MNTPLYQLLDRLYQAGDIKATWDEDERGRYCDDLYPTYMALASITAHYLRSDLAAEIMSEALAGFGKGLAEHIEVSDDVALGMDVAYLLRSEAMNYAEDSDEWQQLMRDITAAETQPRDACDLAKEAQGF